MFITYSQQQYTKKLDVFKKAKGNCVAIDAGKHKTVPYLMVVLINALVTSSPLIIEAVRFFKGKTVDYAATIERILASLLNNGVDIVAIVSDNLRSQVSAVNHTSPESVQQKTSIPKLSSLIWISCSVHTLALSLNDAAKECAYGRLVDHLRSTATFLRSKNIVNVLGVKCPLWAPTRWTGMFDIAFWLLRNNEKIFSVLEASLTHETAYDFPDFIIDGMTIAAATAFCVLLPFYHATHILEADNIPAAYTIPVINSALEQFKSICSHFDIIDEICDVISACVTKRLSFSQSGRILHFLYSLTPLGRREIRESGALEIIGSDKISIETPFSNKFSQQEEELYNRLMENPRLYHEKAESLKQQFAEYKGRLLDPSSSRLLNGHEGEANEEEDGVDIEDININFLRKDELTSSSDDNDESDSSWDHSDFEEEEDFELSEDPMTEVTNGPLQDNIDSLKSIAMLQGYNESDIMKLVTQYSDWILDDPESILVHQEHLQKGHKCWMYYSSYPNLKELATFAHPLMGIVASEASCERAFWQHRRIIGDQGMKTGITLEKAKMFFATN